MPLDTSQAKTVKSFPVVETVLSVQFEPTIPIHTAHLALLWQEYRDRFPKTEERPPLDQTIEQFPEVPPARADFRLQTLESLPVPRLWFLNDQGNEMIQVQRDRFIKNWRKESGEEAYPRYSSSIRPRFDRDYEIFIAFLQKNSIPLPRINQCEVTYVNHIVAGDGWTHHSDLEKIFTFWHSPGQTPPGNAEDARLHARFVIPGQGGNPIGRLHVEVSPAVRTSDHRPMYAMNLTARGQLGTGVDFFEIGHEWIVKSFKALVHERFHG